MEPNQQRTCCYAAAHKSFRSSWISGQYIKTELVKLGWQAGIPIPRMYRFLGTDVDFGSAGAIAEVQFSHYSFLLNNTVRGQLLFNDNTPLKNGHPVRLVIIVTKAQMFPAANSSLSYEQAVDQLTLSAYLFNVPLIIVGLFNQRNTTVPAKLTDYSARTSRKIVNQQDCGCQIIPGSSSRSRSSILII